MKTLKGPSLHLAQFSSDNPPFDSLDSIAGWAAQLGFKALQVPAWDARLFDVALAAQSTGYCDEIKGQLAGHGLQISELTTHMFGQLVAVHPAYDPCATRSRPLRWRGGRRAPTGPSNK
jgi:sugar phosphate isomerase/epimerase